MNGKLMLPNFDSKYVPQLGSVAHSPSGEGAWLESRSPLTGDLLTRILDSRGREVDAAVGKARRAQAEWRDLGPIARASRLRRLAALIRSERDSLALFDVAEVGLPIRTARADVASAADDLEGMAGLIHELGGITREGAGGDHIQTRRLPVGVAGIVTAFNHPFKFAAGKSAAALAAGNGVVIKPPEQATVSSVHLAKLAAEVLPDGLISVATGSGATGALLVEHPDVRRVSFTGSLEAGRRVAELGGAHLKTVTLELGGKNPLVVYPDVDPDVAAEYAVASMNFSRTMGQSCQSRSKLLVHQDIADRVVEGVVARIASLVIGDPFDEKSDMGPLAFEEHFLRVRAHVAAFVAQGEGDVISGGVPKSERPPYFFPPTILDHVPARADILSTEIFGPVLAIHRWSDEGEMLDVANAGPYGLAGTVLTDSVSRSRTAVDGLDVGYLSLNAGHGRARGAPFGGFKFSGLGKEGTLKELESYTKEQAIISNCLY